MSRGSTSNAYPGTTGPPIAAAACLLGLALVWVCAALIRPLHHHDAILLKWFIGLERPRLDKAATSVTKLLDPVPFILGSAVLVLMAFARGRRWTGFAVAATLALVPATAEVLKSLLAHRHATLGGALHIPAATFPSGHAAAALAFGLSAVLVAPRAARPVVVVLAALFAAGIGFCQLILARHMPSDVLGGYLLAGFWTALAIAALRARERDRRAS
jgi:membrane-associated phospholipid phosphatase